MNKPTTKTDTYWKEYDGLFKSFSKRDLFKIVLEKCKSLGKVFKHRKKDKRGRKLKAGEFEYTAFIIVQKIFGHKYREMELESEMYLGFHIDHSTLARTYKKFDEGFVERLISLLMDLKPEFVIADSTNMSSKIKVEYLRSGTRNKKLLTDKFHVVCGYHRREKRVQILGARATDKHISDSKGAIRILENVEMDLSGTQFFGDSAYFTYELQDKIKEMGMISVVKPRRQDIRKKFSAKAESLKMFCKETYKKIRGVVETIFGGSTNAGLILVHSKLEHTRRLDTLMLAVRHNLMSYVKCSGS